MLHSFLGMKKPQLSTLASYVEKEISEKLVLSRGSLMAPREEIGGKKIKGLEDSLFSVCAWGVIQR